MTYDFTTIASVTAVVIAAAPLIGRALLEQGLKERLARVESQLSVQTNWMSARLTRTDERRSLALSRLHTRLDRALHIADLFFSSHDAGNDEARMRELGTACVRTWRDFHAAFERAEIYLSAELAERIRTYGETIADTRVAFEMQRWKLTPHAGLEERLVSVKQALETLSRIRTDVRPQLIKEIRAALGADRIDAN